MELENKIEYRIDNTTFWLMLGTAITIDVIQALIDSFSFKYFKCLL